MGLQPVAAGHPGQHEAPLLVLVGHGQGRALLVDPGRAHLEQLGQQVGLHRLLRHQQDGLQGPGELAPLTHPG